MPINVLPSSQYDLKYASYLALGDKLSSQPEVDEARSGVYLLTFTSLVPDLNWDGGHRYGLLFLLRGGLGRYAEAAVLVACDADGIPLERTPDSRDRSYWVLLTQCEARTTSGNAQRFAERHTLPV
jgi:hypothetical protein